MRTTRSAHRPPQGLVLGGILLGGLAAPSAHAQSIPTWFDDLRIAAHTRFLKRHLDADPVRYVSIASDMAKMGAKVYTRTFNARGEGALWPTATGVRLRGFETENLGKEIVDDAKRAGPRIIAYYRHFESEELMKEHPDWVALNPDGTPAMTPRNPYMSFHSPFVDSTQTRLLELVKLGVDGIYFDETHQPPTGDFSQLAKDAYRRETGRDAPADNKPRNPDFQDYLDFENRTIARTFAKWVPAIKKANPNVAIIISAARWNSWGSRHLSDDVFRYADSVKCEFDAALRPGNNNVFRSLGTLAPVDPDVRQVQAWVTARDVVKGLPPHIWASGLSDATSASAAAAAMIATGAIANLDVKEDKLPDPRFTEAFRMGDAASDSMGGSRPLRWFGVVQSRRAWDARKTNDAQAWREVFWPITGAFQAAYRSRLPVTMVFDRQLEENDLAGYRVLFVGNPDDLSATQRANLGSFEDRGGTVIRETKRDGWSLRGQSDRKIEDLANRLRALAPPATIEGGPEKMVNGFFTRGNRRIFTLANEVSWVHTGTDETQGDPDRLYPGPISGARIVLYQDRLPTSVREAVSGKTLTPRRQGGKVIIDVPKFDHLAVVEVNP